MIRHIPQEHKLGISENEKYKPVLLLTWLNVYPAAYLNKKRSKIRNTKMVWW